MNAYRAVPFYGSEDLKNTERKSSDAAKVPSSLTSNCQRSIIANTGWAGGGFDYRAVAEDEYSRPAQMRQN